MQVILAFELDPMGDHRAVRRELQNRGYVRSLRGSRGRTRTWLNELPEHTNLIMEARTLRVLFEHLGGLPERVLLSPTTRGAASAF